MCGILGIIASTKKRPALTTAEVFHLRDLMADRGPDAAGHAAHENVIFAHRLLAVIDPGHGPQPLWSDDRRYLLVYNGELYNDAELRAKLRAANPGVSFRSQCDTETVLHAFATYGAECVEHLRGMYAFGVYDFKQQKLTLVRDPLGIKPLYFAQANGEFIFASHLPSILGHPAVPVRPCLPAISAYLTTLRTTTGNQTLFEGVQTLLPGQLATVDFSRTTVSTPQIESYWVEPVDHESSERTFNETAQELRRALTDSVTQHLRSDVPICILLSGGLDSAIIATIAKEIGATQALRTWCAGPPEDAGEDRRYAELMARKLHADHHDIVLDRTKFHQHWQHLINETGLPLSTPNETAIYAVGAALKQHATVALSGEGADEFFAGYAMPLLAGIDQLRTEQPRENWPGNAAGQSRFQNELLNEYGTTALGTPAEHYFRYNSWIHPAQKNNLFKPGVFAEIENDTLLLNEIIRRFNPTITDHDTCPQHHPHHLLQVQRQINLTGLLRRLDTALMTAQVEGRTPFADVRIAELAATIPFDYKMQIQPPQDGGWSVAAVTVAEKKVITKAVLRKAFADSIPEEILKRPKASFPLPFQDWLADAGSTIRNSRFLNELIHPETLLIVAADPSTHWQTAWPLANLALWAKRWWG